MLRQQLNNATHPPLHHGEGDEEIVGNHTNQEKNNNHHHSTTIDNENAPLLMSSYENSNNNHNNNNTGYYYDEVNNNSNAKNINSNDERFYGSTNHHHHHYPQDSNNFGLHHPVEEEQEEEEDSDDYYEDLDSEDDFHEEYDDDDDDGRRKKSKNRCWKCFQLATEKPGPIRTVLSPFRKVWHVACEAVILVSNVDNVWDSPAAAALYMPNSSSSSQPPLSSFSKRGDYSSEMVVVTTRHKLGVLFWFFVLTIGYATERSTFKILVDRTGPFRMTIGSLGIPLLHGIILLTWMSVKAFVVANSLCRPLWNYSNSPHRSPKKMTFWGQLIGNGLGIPITDIAFMGILDTFHLLLVSITGNHVSPIMTVILVQLTIPLTTIITQFNHKEGKCYGVCCPDNLETNRTRNNSNHNNRNHQNHHLLSNNSSTAVTGTSSSSPMTHPNNNSNSLESNKNKWGGMTKTQIFGSTLIFFSILLAVGPATMKVLFLLFDGKDDTDKNVSYPSQLNDTVAWNTVIFAISCIFAAASQQYKEHVFCKHKMPIDTNQINFTISVLSFFAASVFSPLLYTLQGLSQLNNNNNSTSGEEEKAWWSLYSSTDISSNYHDAYECFLGTLENSTQENGYPEIAHCKYSWLLSILHVFSILSIGVAVDKIVNAGAIKILFRGLSTGIIAAMVSMLIYQIFYYSENSNIPKSNLFLDSWQIFCSIVLILGSEVYHGASVQEPTFETVYPDIGTLYYED